MNKGRKFFRNLPLNWSRLFTMQKDKSGCEIYVPVLSNEDIPYVKEQLKEILKNQPIPHTSNIPPRIA